MNKPLVSIIMPAYNSAKFVSLSIESVIGQSFTDWELIIVDDNSRDNTVQIIESYVKLDTRIKLYHTERNTGDPSVPRNLALDHSTGRYIAFLDSDDMWRSQKLENQISFMESQNVELCYSYYDQIDEHGASLNRTIVAPLKIDYHDLLCSCYIGCLTAIYDSKRIGKIRFSVGVKQEDYVLWLKVIKLVGHAYGIDSSLGLYRVRRGSVSSNKFRLAISTWNIYYNIEKLGMVKSVYFYGIFVYNWLKKRI